MAQVQTPIHIELTAAERSELERISRAESLTHQTVVRARVVLGLVDGSSVSAIARQVGRQQRIVRKWADRFVGKRSRGLDDAPRSGRPARFSCPSPEFEPRVILEVYKWFRRAAHRRKIGGCSRSFSPSSPPPGRPSAPAPTWP